MPLSVLALVLLGALAHATWNAVVKGGEDKLLTTAAVNAAAGLLAACALPFLPQPAPASWPFIAASVACQTVYLALVAAVYRTADMSQAYPLMRGTAPLLVAGLGAGLLGERISPVAWAGIGLICLGILGLASASRRAGGGGTGLALLTAAVIAAYTLVDGAGVRRSGAPAGYTLWLFLLTALPLTAWVAARRGAALAGLLCRRPHPVLVGGVGTLASYGLALWAMTRAPVAVVAALRETSILFAVAIGGLVLKEPVGRRRVALACLMAAGAVVLRMA